MPEPLPIALLDELAGPADGLDERVAAAVAAHPEMEGAFEPVGEILVDASIDLVLRGQHDDNVVEISGKLGPGGFVYAVPTRAGSTDGWWQAAPLTAAPRLLAGLMGLGPRGERPAAPEFVPVPREALEAACGRAGAEPAVDALVPAMAADGIPEATARAILSRAAALWQLGLVAAGDNESTSGLAVVDAPGHGLWLAHDAPGGALLQAATPTTVWRALCDVLGVGRLDPAAA